MKVRPYTDEDYRTINSWWVDHNNDYIEKEFLSDLGIVVENEGRMIAVGWVYLSNSKLAKLGFIVSNPESRLRERVKAVHRIFIEAELILKKQGYVYIQMISDHSALTKIGLQNNWQMVKPHEVIVKKIA